VGILAQASADFALTYNFQGTHILGASRGYLCDSVASCSALLKYRHTTVYYILTVIWRSFEAAGAAVP